MPSALIPVGLTLLNTACLESNSVYEEVLPAVHLVIFYHKGFFCSFLQMACQTWDADQVNYSSGEKWVQTCKYLRHIKISG